MYSPIEIVSTLVALIAFFNQLNPAATFFIDKHQSPATHKWSYQRQVDWSHEHKQCGHNVQSPIDIQRRNVIASNQLKLHFYNYNQPTKFRIENAHHTIKLNPVEADDQFGLKLRPDGEVESLNSSSLPDLPMGEEDGVEPEYETAKQHNNSHRNHHQHPHLSAKPIDSNGLEEQPGVAYDGAPTIKLDWLDEGNNEYKLRDIHFHWGDRRDNGSEHAIDGRRAAMEMHLVHIKYGLDQTKIGFTSDSVAVIAVLIESLRKSNADFNPIVNSLTRINMTDQPQEIEYKSINDLLPNVLNQFYTYSGSLTTPPCYQVVNWIVMSDRLYLNAKQIEMFRNLYAPVDSSSDEQHNLDLNLIMPNIRQIQSLNNRTILASFSPFSRLEQMSQTPFSAASSVVMVQNKWLIFLVLYGFLLRLATKRLLLPDAKEGFAFEGLQLVWLLDLDALKFILPYTMPISPRIVLNESILFSLRTIESSDNQNNQ